MYTNNLNVRGFAGTDVKIIHISRKSVPQLSNNLELHYNSKLFVENDDNDNINNDGNNPVHVVPRSLNDKLSFK